MSTLVEGVVRLCHEIPPSDGKTAASPVAPYRVVNIGGGYPVGLLTFVEEIEAALERRAKRNYVEGRPDAVPKTEASTALLDRWSAIGRKPRCRSGCVSL